jgi:hypothetical protein
MSNRLMSATRISRPAFHEGRGLIGHVLHLSRIGKFGFMSPAPASTACLHIVAEADPGALPRILERFQTLNVCPTRVRCDLSASGFLRIEVEAEELPGEALEQIARKLRQLPFILDARLGTGRVGRHIEPV